MLFPKWSKIFFNLILSSVSLSRTSELQGRYNEIHEDNNIVYLLADIIVQINEEVKCLAAMFDGNNKKAFTKGFFSVHNNMSYFMIEVKESEDLLSPNYLTLKSIQQANHQGCNAFIILLTNKKQASRLIRFVDRYRLINSHAKLIMLYDRRLFSKDLNYIWKKFINTVFIEKVHYSGAYKIRSVPFPVQFQPIVPLLINSWYQGKFQNNKNLFPDKVFNLRGQPLKIITFDHVPSAVKKKRTDNMQEGNEVQFTGIEIEIVKSLSEAVNFHPVIYESEADQWGEKQANASYSGLLGELINGKADIALGNLYHIPYYLKLVDLTIPYTTQCLTFLTPESGIDNSWKILLMPFKLNMWIAILATLFVGGFLFYFLAIYHRNLERKTIPFIPLRHEIRKKSNIMKAKEFRVLARHKTSTNSVETDHMVLEYATEHEGLYLFEELQNSILYTYGMLVLVSLPKIPSGWALRIMTGWWWLYCVLVVVSYRASMTACLANPPPRVTIDTLQELATSNIQCGGWSATDKEFFTTSLDIEAQRIGMKFIVLKEIDSAIFQVAQGSFAYYENIYFLKNARINFLWNSKKKNFSENSQDSNLHIMSECMIKMPISIGLEANSPLKIKFDRLLQRLVEAGLVNKWLDDVLLATLSAEGSYTTKQINALMNLKKMYGALVALVFGYVISIFVLMFEKFYWMYVVTRHPLFDRYSMSRFYKRRK